ncbi:MAG: antitoxin Xre-like helix-turn-helix domain-containing protein [Thermomicrobiales bacterium]|jgi:transcriptional regulator with XRE-family HTH domain
MALYAVPSVATNPLRLREQLHLSRERMARLMDVSAKTIERWEARKALPLNRSTRERLSRIQEITELGHAVYSPEGLERFLTTPLPVFDGATALQMIEIGHADRVLSALAADYEGLGG